MLPDFVRRIAAVLLTLVFVFGPVANGVYAFSMGAKMTVTASSDAHSPSKCDDCGAAKGRMPAGTCSAASYCSGPTTFPSANNAVFGPLPGNMLAPYDARHLTGSADAPDPYPPRTIILS